MKDTTRAFFENSIATLKAIPPTFDWSEVIEKMQSLLDDEPRTVTLDVEDLMMMRDGKVTSVDEKGVRTNVIPTPAAVEFLGDTNGPRWAQNDLRGDVAARIDALEAKVDRLARNMGFVAGEKPKPGSHEFVISELREQMRELGERIVRFERREPAEGPVTFAELRDNVGTLASTYVGLSQRVEGLDKAVQHAASSAFVEGVVDGLADRLAKLEQRAAPAIDLARFGGG